MRGDADLATAGAVVSDPARGRILLALGDGRALPASVLGDEAAIATSTASAHLSKLLDGGLLAVEQHGRYRYFRIAGPDVGDLLEALARLAPAAPVRSLRQGTRAQAVRFLAAGRCSSPTRDAPGSMRRSASSSIARSSPPHGCRRQTGARV